MDINERPTGGLLQVWLDVVYIGSSSLFYFSSGLAECYWAFGSLLVLSIHYSAPVVGGRNTYSTPAASPVRCALLQSVLMLRLSRIFLSQVFLLMSIASIGQQKTRADIDSVVNNIEISFKSYARVHMRSRKIDKLEDYQYFVDTTAQKLGKVLSYPDKHGISRTFYFSHDKLLKAFVVKYISKTERQEANVLFSNKREICRSDPAHILPNIQQLLKEAREISDMLNIIRTRK